MSSVLRRLSEIQKEKKGRILFVEIALQSRFKVLAFLRFLWNGSRIKLISPATIRHVRYINVLAWLRGFRVKIANFSSFFCLSIPKGDLDTKKRTPNIEVWPESLGAMLENWYIERGLLTSGTFPAENSSFFNHLTGVITKIYEVFFAKHWLTTDKIILTRFLVICKLS